MSTSKEDGIHDDDDEDVGNDEITIFYSLGNRSTHSHSGTAT